jgi:AraC family transcriptional regulator, regulatory protein of adaptative response / DNA-3-methyladenine glycosylase II
VNTLTKLSYHAPFDWLRMLRFLHARSVKGVEAVRAGSYLRTVQIGSRTGWISVRDEPSECALLVEATHSLTPVLPTLLERLRALFDLSARPELVSAHFARDPVLADSVALRPGLRVPGAFSGFELAARAILGQQITVKAATTLAGRFAAELGEPIETPHAELTHLSPDASRVAASTVDAIASLGVIQTRARSLIAIAQEIQSERLTLEAGAHPEAAIEQLIALPGIGAWTAHYIAMRALRWADAFPKEDIALRNALGRVSAARAEQLSQPWRPWRSYATIHLWCEAGERDATPSSEWATTSPR